MNNKNIAIAMAMTLIVGLTVGVWWSHRSTSITSSAMKVSEERKVLYWHDPMMPNQKFDKPGKSPFMDMQLVPVYADEASDDAGIKVNSSVTQSLGIRFGTVEKTIVQQRLSAVGSVAFDEHRLQLIQARVTGYVTKLFVKAQLDHVRKGQVLAEITSPEWSEAQAEYATLLQNNSPQSKTLLPAARQRLQVLNVPEQTIAAIERTHETLPTTQILAPLDGVITELGVREGSSFMAGTTLFRINGLETVWVNAQVPEAQIHLVPMGASVTARAASWPSEILQGRVEALLPEVDANTRTFTVRAVLSNPHNKLSPGMFLSLDISPQKGEAQLVVPSEAVIMTGQRAVVIVVNDDQSFNAVDVVVGSDVDGSTVIIKGLEEGQRIVRSGQFLIDSEASLKSTLDRLSSMPPSNDAPAEHQP